METLNQFYHTGLGIVAPKVRRILVNLIKKINEKYPKYFSEIDWDNIDNIPDRILRELPYKYLPAWAINSYQLLPKVFNGKRLIRDLRLLCFLLRFSKCYRYQNSKKRLFYLTLLCNTINTCLFLIYFNNKRINHFEKKYKTLYRRLVYLLNILFLQLTRYKFVYLQYNKKIFRSRLILFNLYAKILLLTLRKTTFISTNHQLIVKFMALHNRNFSAQFLVNYISLKLGQYFRLNSIIKPIIRRFLRIRSITGFRFIISGRLTRKERAAYIVHSHKSMPLATSSVAIDYAYDFRIMRFGVVGIKVFLRLSKIIPYYYFFEFKNNL